LGGQGFGTVLAWETARVLAAQGRLVSLLALIDPPPSAFFESEPSSPTPRYRFIKPGGSSGGLFSRFLKKSSNEDAGVTKELRQAREHYGNVTLAAATWPVFAFGSSNGGLPWKNLSAAEFSVHSVDEFDRVLGDLLVK
jgi:hypothetical protein